MSFTGIPLVLDQWFNVGGGKVCNLTATRVFSSQPIQGQGQGPGAPPEQGAIFFWYKADAQSFSNGALANPIIDSGPNGYHLITNSNPPPSSQQDPHFFTNVINGLPVFGWGGPLGADLIFRNITSFNPLGITYLLVHRRTVLNATYSGIYISPAAGATTQYQIRDFDSGSSNVRFQGESASTFVNLTVPLGTWQIVSFSMDDTEGIPRLKTNVLSAAGTAGPGSMNIIQVRLVGKNDMEIAECLGYNKKLSDSSLHDARAYLSAKYAIGIT
jgi:hypothetical protein